MTDRMALRTNGFEMTGFDVVRLKNRIDQLAGSFELIAKNQSLPELKKAKSKIVKGADCVLYRDGKTALTGYVDKVVKAYDTNGQPFLRVFGLSTAGDFAASDSEGKEYKNQTPAQILNDVLSGFNLTLKDGLNAAALDVFSISPAESFVSAVSRLLDRTNALLFSLADGTLFLTKRSAAGFKGVRLQTGKDNLTAAVRLSDCAGDFSKITVLGQSVLADEHDIDAVCGAAATKSFSSNRFKKKVVFADLASIQTVEKTAARCNKRGEQINLTAKGWNTADINTLVEAKDEWLDLSGKYLVAGIAFEYDEIKGHTTTLELEAVNV